MAHRSQDTRIGDDIRILPAGLSEAHRVTLLLMHSFASEAITRWVWGWPRYDISKRYEEIREAIPTRLPGVKRMCADPEMRFFIAQGSQHQDLGFSAWCVPTTSNAGHLLHRLTWREWSYAWLAHIYDIITAGLVPKSIYAYFYPRRAKFEENKQRWRVMEAQVTKPCIRKEHAEKGYWKLAYLGVLPEHQGKGLASRLLRWGLDEADKEDRAVYLQASQLAVRLYERHGFKMITCPQVVTSNESGGPLEMAIMCRPPSSERNKE